MKRGEKGQATAIRFWLELEMDGYKVRGVRVVGLFMLHCG
jgi:hypothetical protein